MNDPCLFIVIYFFLEDATFAIVSRIIRVFSLNCCVWFSTYCLPASARAEAI